MTKFPLTWRMGAMYSRDLFHRYAHSTRENKGLPRQSICNPTHWYEWLHYSQRIEGRYVIPDSPYDPAVRMIELPRRLATSWRQSDRSADFRARHLHCPEADTRGTSGCRSDNAYTIDDDLSSTPPLLPRWIHAMPFPLASQKLRC